MAMLVSEGCAAARLTHTGVTCAAIQGHGIIQARGVAGAMSESMALPQPGSALMSETPLAIKGCAYVLDLSGHLGPCMDV